MWKIVVLVSLCMGKLHCTEGRGVAKAMGNPQAGIKANANSAVARLDENEASNDCAKFYQFVFQLFIPEQFLKLIGKYSESPIVDGKYQLTIPYFENKNKTKIIMEKLFEGLSYGAACNEYHFVQEILLMGGGRLDNMCGTANSESYLKTAFKIKNNSNGNYPGTSEFKSQFEEDFKEILTANECNTKDLIDLILEMKSSDKDFTGNEWETLSVCDCQLKTEVLRSLDDESLPEVYLHFELHDEFTRTDYFCENG